ncbi:hypothetical protein LSAT2_020180 [Lamellibrachia satsuma]|nr:hypothetical protein LSAT2_020180 [Lamellibrachia satsuma]
MPGGDHCTSRVHFSGRRAEITMTVLAGVSLVSSAFKMTGRRLSFLRLASNIYVAVVLICAFATMVFMYTMMARIMWVRLRRLRTIGSEGVQAGDVTLAVCASTMSSTHAQPLPLSAVAVKAQQQTTKGMRVLLVVTIVFIVCWTPLGIASCGVSIPPPLLYLFIVNSVINPFIYSFMSSEFRKGVRQLFCWA